MNIYAVVETNNNRLVSFANTEVDIPNCYLVPGIDSNSDLGDLIGKRYNNGVWDDVTVPITEEDKFASDYAKALGRI